MTINKIQDTIDNGKSKITLYDVDGSVIEHKYNYGKGFGFLFLTKYNSIEHYNNRMSMSGSELIYSSTNQNDCTEKGREIEFLISRL